MSLHDDNHDRRRRKPNSQDADDSPPAPARRKRQAGDVGNALRAAYDRMVDEDIPPEMLDLLGKLG